MKALTLTQPWANEMVDGWKTYETRSWRTNYRGLLAIHAAIGFPVWAREFAETERALGRVPTRIARGAILGVVNVLDCIRAEEAALDVSALERHLGDYSFGRWAWKTELVKKLDAPIACRGALGLWEVPSEIAAILAEVVEVVG